MSYDINSLGAVCDNEDEIKCDNEICVDPKYVCMLDYDEYGNILGCRDRSLLRNCDAFKCPSHTYKCSNSYCITIKSRCDGTIDCENGEDELNCDEYDCPGSFKCQDASNCISQNRVCDNIKDCIRGDDELFCNVTCPEGCTCTDLSFNCSGIDWDADKAALIPSDIRYLNMSSVSSHTSEGTSIAETIFMNPDNFTFIVVLDISGNNVKELMDQPFAKLYHLKTLYIHTNQIKTITDDVFKDLMQLKYLDLHGNGVKYIDEMAFSELAELEYLDISANDIEQVDKNIFMDLTSLKTLISDDHSFCCLLNPSMDVDCTPAADVFSSCANLMQNEILRIFLWAFGISALFGNMFVIGWRCRNWPSRDSASYTQSLLVMNLAVSDALMGVYMLIIASADVFYRDDYVTHAKHWKQSLTCTFAGILAFLSSELSVFTLTVLSCDRFLHIAFPFRSVHLTSTSVKYAVALGWFLTIVMSAVPILPLPYFNNEFYGVTSVCLALPLTSERVLGWEYTAAIFIGFNMFCFVLIFVCYAGLFILVKISSSNIQQTGNINTAKNQHIAMALRMGFIIATDFCCWMPIIIMGMLSLTRTVDIPAEVYAWSAVFVLPINSAINPYLYTIASMNKLQKQLNPSKKRVHKTGTGSSAVSFSVSHNASRTENKRKGGNLSAVERMEALVTSNIDTGNTAVNAEIHQLLSKALQLTRRGNNPVQDKIGSPTGCMNTKEQTKEETKNNDLV
ncbi:uncharacterized protein [Antedon mediterranea]|uniref:uncharacterized protein n=1 Tax=Antedon mediterranea TaxID=105859 RepID=UPI003AF8539C